MELGEHIRETLRREIMEELGADISIGDLLGVYSNRGAFKYPSGDVAYVVGVFFVCTLCGELNVDGIETLEARFFDKESFPDEPWSMHKQPLEDFFNGERKIIR